MADKQITVAVPEERVPEFYVWFANFLMAEPGSPLPWDGPGGRGRGRGHRHGHRCGGGHHRAEPREGAATEPETQTA